MKKKKVAVFFGGKSFEHDVSILTGLEVCTTIDSTKYDVMPVYVDLEGIWWIGEDLLLKSSYPLNDYVKRDLHKTKLIIGQGKGYLEYKQEKLFGTATKRIDIDVIFNAFHGGFGETGYFQGLCELANIPYTGCGVEASAIFMDKSATKLMAKRVGIPVLDEVLIAKPQNHDFFDINDFTKDVKFPFPLMVKPNSLGSSVGIKKVNNKEELNSAVLQIFALGDNALVEPFVENLEEYNISVTRVFGKVECSVIERPSKKDSEVLDFKEKYMSGGKGGKCGKCGKAGSKLMSASERRGLLSLSRTFNPKELTDEETKNIQKWAKAIFEYVGGCGNPRIDFLCNSKTREIYFGEANPLPGSFAYYLWEASTPSRSYTELLTALIEEAENNFKKRVGIVLTESKIFME